MKAKCLVALGIVAVIVPFVIAQQAGQERPAIQPREAMPGQAGLQPQKVDQSFLKCAIQDNLFEQEAAKVVADKAPNEQVKQFAQKLQEDHKEAAEQLRKVAQGKQMQVPNKMENWQQQKLQAMQQLEPEELQTAFLFGTIGEHHKDILMHKWASQKGQDAEVKTLAQRQIPTLQQHLQQATRLTQQVAGISAEPMGVTGR